mgnify:CR=1 FL=1
MLRVRPGTRSALALREAAIGDHPRLTSQEERRRAGHVGILPAHVSRDARMRVQNHVIDDPYGAPGDRLAANFAVGKIALDFAPTSIA